MQAKLPPAEQALAPAWIAEAIHRTKQAHMIPFILVIPVSPHAADRKMGMDDRLAMIAGREMKQALNKWREDANSY